MMYVLQMLWQERQRFFAGVLAVAFSAVLISLQCGLLLGLFSITSIPVDHTSADIWVGAPQVLSVDLGRPIPKWFLSRVASQPEVVETETYIQGFGYFSKPMGGTELCMVIACRMQEGSLGMLDNLTPDLRRLLSEPDSIVVDESDLPRLGLKGVGDQPEINGYRVRVVGMAHGLKSFAGPYVLCSQRTAMHIMNLMPSQTIYILGRCRTPEEAKGVVERLSHHDDMTIMTSEQFSWRTRTHWLTTTKGGIGMGYAAVLGLLVGAVVTSQTLYSATASSFRQYATLEALGLPRWRLASMVLIQAFWIGVVGILLSFPSIYVLANIAELLGVPVLLEWWLLLASTVVTMLMAMLSGLWALRSLRHMEVVSLLR